MFHNQLGESKCAMVKYAKDTLLTFSFEEKFLRVGINPVEDYKMIIDKVEELMTQNQNLK